MRGIYFKDGIYVYEENISDVKNDYCVYSEHVYVFLYGNRVHICCGRITIDGVQIKRLDLGPGSFYPVFSPDFPMPLIVTYLNSIEANGVDAFMTNYKKDIEFAHNEMMELRSNFESQSLKDGDNKQFIRMINDINNALMVVMVILFNLNSYLPSGLENEKVITVYQSIKDSI